jgi:hypothetical protein
MPQPCTRQATIGNKRSFVKSTEFQKKADAAIAQAVGHRNTTPLYQLLAMFERTQYFKALVAYFRDRAGVWPEFEYDRVVLKLGTPMKGTLPSFSRYLDRNKGSIKDVLGSQARMRHVAHVDALTPGIRLPGSFESGRK